MGKKGLFEAALYSTVKTLQVDLGPQNLLESFIGLIISSKTNLCFKGRPTRDGTSLPKRAKKVCSSQFFTLAKQQDDLRPQNLLESFFGWTHRQLQTKFVPYVLTRDVTMPTEMSNRGPFERVLHSSNTTR